MQTMKSYYSVTQKEVNMLTLLHMGICILIFGIDWDSSKIYGQ